MRLAQCWYHVSRQVEDRMAMASSSHIPTVIQPVAKRRLKTCMIGRLRRASMRFDIHKDLFCFSRCISGQVPVNCRMSRVGGAASGHAQSRRGVLLLPASSPHVLPTCDCFEDQHRSTCRTRAGRLSWRRDQGQDGEWSIRHVVLGNCAANLPSPPQPHLPSTEGMCITEPQLALIIDD